MVRRMSHQLRFLVLLICLCFTAASVRAQFFSNDTTKIQFAPAQVQDGVTWSDNFSLSDTGLLAAKLPPNMSASVWVQSQPIPAGRSWRPPTSASIVLTVEAGEKDFTYRHAYFRYSCDRVHWSTWYNLTVKGQSGVDASVYEGHLDIPRTAMEAYQKKQFEWVKSNPVWLSDEHELCVWIVRQDPEFFAREFPFIGYVQVRVEGETRGAQIKSLSINISSAVSGLTSINKGKGRSTIGEKWFFDASKIKQ